MVRLSAKAPAASVEPSAPSVPAPTKNPVHVSRIESATGDMEPAAGAFAVPMNRRRGLNGVKTGLKDRSRILSHGFKRFDIRAHHFSGLKPTICISLIPKSKIRQSKRARPVFEKTLLRRRVLDKHTDSQYLVNTMENLFPVNGLFEG